MVLEDGSVYPQKGCIDFADRTVDAGTGTLRLRAQFPNPDGFLRPGGYARIRMVLRKLKDALMVSERALCVDQGGAYLLVVDAEDKVERRAITIGPKEDGMAVVVAGLNAGERVVVKGLQQARPGNTVKVMREDAGTGPAAEAPAPAPSGPAAKPAAVEAQGRNEGAVAK